MYRVWIFIVASALAGCATEHHAVVAPVNSASAASAAFVPAATATRMVDTRYEVRAYRDAEDPAVRHEAHAIYRATRVPACVASLDVAPRTDFEPATYAPLPPSAELAAELATQRQITADLRAMQARMEVVERQARNQYDTLVRQTTETMQVRGRHEEHVTTAPRPDNAAESSVPTPVAAVGETKW